MTGCFSTRTLRYLLFALPASAVLSGCAMVSVRTVGPEQYIAMRRADVLSTGRLSAATRDLLHVAALDERTCRSAPQACIDSMSTVGGIDVDRRLAGLAELSLQMAIANTPVNANVWSDAQFDLWLRTVRFAYAFLFFGQRTSGERAFEDRQTQVRDYYNYATQEVARAMFHRSELDENSPGLQRNELAIAGWIVHIDLSRVRLPEDVVGLRELIPASGLSFAGLRSVHRRDGLGAELVAVTTERASVASDTDAVNALPFREMPSPNVTALMWFSGDSLEQVLRTHDAVLSVYDPFREQSVLRLNQQVPLAANFSAGYGIWLARSGFAGQSLRTLFGRARGIDRPLIYMMQPFDPQRRIVLMLHGLASSPEAWVNVANDIQGDEVLRRHFQVWQVYYPTNVPILVNLSRIRQATQLTLAHFDPHGKQPASHAVVLIGHSMGGVLARLLVSTSDDRLRRTVEKNNVPAGTEVDPDDERINRLLRFTPMPQVERAIFIAAPHRGTPFAGNRLSRWVANLVRLPLALMQEIDDVVQTATNADSSQRAGKTFHVPNSIEQLRDTNPTIQVTSLLPISPQVCFHSIIARRRQTGPLEDSDDGVVPYRSAHIGGARSEMVIVSGHSVQETPQAIAEIRRILHQDIDEFDDRSNGASLAVCGSSSVRR